MPVSAVRVAPARASGEIGAPSPGEARGRAPRPTPPGEPRSGVWIDPGRRNPISLVGPVVQVTQDDTPGRGGWAQITVGGAGPEAQRRFALLLGPEPARLPVGPGERVAVELDCRRGGFHRVCDATVRDARRRLLAAIAGSGYRRLVSGWDVTAGARATSEVLREEPLSVRHTGGVVVAMRGRRWSVAPLAWTRIDTPEGPYLVHGESVSWEGTRPPDARDHVAWAALRWE